MIAGISFGRGVFFHNRKVLACAEVKRGVIHVWAEPITFRTLWKMWMRILFSIPWYYQLFHLLLLAGIWWYDFNPLWLVVYGAGFHFVFPKQLKQFHGAEHKVFSYSGEKNMEALLEIQQASIVNAGCSTNYVTYFFVSCLLTCWFHSLVLTVGIGILSMLAGMIGEKYARRYMKPLFALSGWLQQYVTTKEPDRIHLETAIRSYRLFQHYQT
ncbi:DUF1385 domain-containing protein [Brevibacillus ginsengisoli]|uniref:DUF1385 domain-containing protein n=1 Tax=Brevibacillus ginsengisoli TaxID=363854 RepID=UPI003CEBFAD9